MIICSRDERGIKMLQELIAIMWIWGILTGLLLVTYIIGVIVKGDWDV